MFAQFAPAAPLEVPPDALSALTDALSTGSWIVAACVAVLILAPLILKAFGVKVPFLDPIVLVLLSVAKSFSKPKEAAASVPAKPAEGVGDVAQVHDINELKGPKQ